VIAFLRRDGTADGDVLVVCNFTPVPRYNYRIGVPRGGRWREALNSDAGSYGGSGLAGGLTGCTSYQSAPLPSHGYYHSLYMTLPPLAAVYLVRDPEVSA
jgi:1,4-alpha-glucan branching enzyme